MEFFGWETPFGEFFNNNSQKQILAVWPSGPNFFRGAASFEL
jgi:hypothetical protein